MICNAQYNFKCLVLYMTQRYNIITIIIILMTYYIVLICEREQNIRSPVLAVIFITLLYCEQTCRIMTSP